MKVTLNLELFDPEKCPNLEPVKKFVSSNECIFERQSSFANLVQKALSKLSIVVIRSMSESDFSTFDPCPEN